MSYDPATPTRKCSHNVPREPTLNHVEPVTQVMSYDDEIKFRVGAEKEAVKILDELRVGGVNISQLAREGFQEKLREAVSDDDRIRIYEMYDEGEIDEDVARVFLGDDLDRMGEEIHQFEDVHNDVDDRAGDDLEEREER